MEILGGCDTGGVNTKCPPGCSQYWVMPNSPGGTGLTQTTRLLGEVSRLGPPSIAVSPSGCGELGSCRVDPATGNLQLHLTVPEAGPLVVLPVFTYNALSPASGEFGFGWTG